MLPEKSENKVRLLSQKLEKAMPRIAPIAPAGFNVGAAFRVYMTAISRSPKLLQCDDVSLINCLLNAAELGLFIGPTLGHCHAVPFFNGKQQRMEATFMIGYQGMVELVRRSGAVENLSSEVWYEKDFFEVKLGTNPVLNHIPYGMTPDSYGKEDRGQPVGAYCVVKFKDGGYYLKTLTVAQIEAYRRRSRASKDGPWVTDWDPMACKTTIRRAFPFLPKTTQIMQAAENEDRSERGELHPDLGKLGIDLEDVMLKSKSERVLADIKERQLEKEVESTVALAEDKAPEPVDLDDDAFLDQLESQEPVEEVKKPRKRAAIKRSSPEPAQTPPVAEKPAQAASELEKVIKSGLPEKDPDTFSAIEVIHHAFDDLPTASADFLRASFAKDNGVSHWTDVRDTDKLADLYDRIMNVMDAESAKS